ncbi:hypothetical protein [Plantactinospora veratri]
MPELDFSGLGQAAQAAFKPHFADVERRARRRRRRTRVAGAAALAAVVAVGGGVVWRAVPSDEDGARYGTLGPPVALDRTPDFVPTPGPSASPGAPTPAAPTVTGQMLVGDLDRLYLRYRDCQGRTARSGSPPPPTAARPGRRTRCRCRTTAWSTCGRWGRGRWWPRCRRCRSATTG